jgi:hypothetical protein
VDTDEKKQDGFLNGLNDGLAYALEARVVPPPPEPPVFCLWCFVPLCRSLGLVISFVLIYVVINTGYIVYFTIYRFMCENSSWNT